MVGLDWTRQEDFAAGAVRGVARHLISSRGTYDVLNGLHDDDGSVYRRGGSVDKSAAGGTPSWVWDGAGLGRTLLGSRGGDVEVLLADDTTRQTIFGNSGISRPVVRPAMIDGIAWIPGNPGATLYAGSLKTADYATGSVSVTNGSPIVLGAGTSWLANLDPGMLLSISGDSRYYVVASVDSNTQVTLLQSVERATAAGLAYTAKVSGIYVGATSPLTVPADFYAVHENRLIFLVGGDSIYFSDGRNATTGALQAHKLQVTSFHKLPSGVIYRGVQSLRDRLLIFTSAGVYAITNMAFNLVDAAGNVQQRMEKINEDVILWGDASIATYGDSLVIAAQEHVYVWDGITAPVSVSDTSFPVLRAHVAAGRIPGVAAVFNGHYLLPVLEPATGACVETLVFRLDRPVQTGRGLAFPFSRFDGGGACSSYAVRRRTGAGGVLEAPVLLGADRARTRITVCTKFFAPDSAVRADSAGNFTFAVETRDWHPGDGAEVQVRRARSRYELVDSAGTATVTLSVDNGIGATSLGARGVSDGRAAQVWQVEKRCRLVRYRFTTSDACDRLVLRSIAFAYRAKGR